MTRYHQLTRRVQQLLDAYNGHQPFNLYLKEYFRLHKEMGSTDRKIFAAMAYGVFRYIGATNRTLSDEQMECAAMLQPDLPDVYKKMLLEHNPQAAKLHRAAEGEKVSCLKETGWTAEDYFPAADAISALLPQEDIVLSHLIPRWVWLRVRKGKRAEVEKELKIKQYEYQVYSDVALLLPKHYPLQQTDAYQKGWFELQDIASQQTLRHMKPNAGEHWFDACAGSGGKSLMLLDAEPAIHLTMNEPRAEMLDECRRRMARLNLPLPKMMQADLSAGIYEALGPFDGIVADLPCSGSGTWGRSPERLAFFETSQISAYARQQRAIVEQCVKVLAPRGALYYITCSVYAEENENNVQLLCERLQLQTVRQEYLSYHHEGGDTLYLAVLVRS